MPNSDITNNVQSLLKSIRKDLIVNPEPDLIGPARELANRLYEEWTDGKLASKLCSILALHYHNYADVDLATLWLDRAKKAAVGLPVSEAWVAYTHAAMLTRERKSSEALQLLEPYEVAGSVSDLAVDARIQTLRAGIFDALGRVDEAEAAFRQALALREELGEKIGLATVYFNYGEFCMKRDESERAMEYFLKCYDIERANNNLTGLAQTTCHIAQLYARRGNKQDALEFYDIARISAASAGVPIVTAVVKANGAQIYESLGDEISQLTALLDAKTYLDRYEFPSIRGQVLGNLGSLYVNRGEFDKAEPLLTEAIAISEAEEHRYTHGYWLLVMGKLRNRQGRHAEAIPLLVRARDQLAMIQAHVYTLHAFSELAQAQASLGATREAYESMAKWASAYIEQHSEDVESRMRRVQRIHEQERQDRDREIERLRNVELSDANAKLEEANALLEEKNTRIQQANKELIELASEKDEFMTIAAHDLRNPLSDMRSVLQTVLNHYDILSRDDVLDVTKELLTIVTRMGATIHGFLEISRTDKRTGGLNIDHLDLTRFTHRAIERLYARAEGKDIVISVKGSDEPAWGMGDPSIVDSVLDNLISNAIKFSPSDSIITITVQGGDTPSITVTDQGQGVAEADIPKLFTKFSRLSSQPTNGEESIGLGLYLSKRMAQRMMGTIEYEHQPGGGATFIFRIPNGNNG